MSLLTLEDKRKYPFLPRVVEEVRELGLTVRDLDTPLGEEILRRAAERVVASIKGYRPSVADDYRDEALSFLTALLMLRVINDPMLTRRFAVAEAKRFSAHLRVEEGEKVVEILRELFGWRMRDHGGTLLIHFADYLENIPEYRGPWKLVNRPLRDGWVALTPRELARLGEEGLKRYIYDKVHGSGEVPELPGRFLEYVEAVKGEWSKVRGEIEAGPAAAAGTEDAYPPCIRAILEDLRAGKNLSHSARFALATFLLHIGKDVEEVMELFRAAPDFREEVARYQVEHLAGLRGSKVKYLPFKCENMRSLGLCRWDCGVRHPLQYFYRRLRGSGRGKGRGAGKGSV